MQRYGLGHKGLRVRRTNEYARLFLRRQSVAPQETVVGRSRPRLINYGAPPVVEVAVSVQFEPPQGFNVGHLGAFWASQKGNFPSVVAAPPISAPLEDFSTDGQWLPPALRLAFINEPPCRLQMTSGDGQWMRQIQPDRLVVNWRKKAAVYPRFDAALDQFLDAWRALQHFFAGEHMTAPAPRLWEVAYVNRIPKGELWEFPSDWPTVFPGLWGGTFVAAEVLTLRGLQGQWVWDFPAEHARLYVEPSPARSAEDSGMELLMLNLTARGPIRLNGDMHRTAGCEQPIQAGMELGHDLIVFTFDAIASDRAKEHWQRHA